MAGVQFEAPGVTIFEPPEGLSVAGMEAALMPQGVQTQFMSTAKKAGIITSGLTLAPLLTMAATASLTNTGTFLRQLFGTQGESLQKRAIEDMQKVAQGQVVNNPGLAEFVESQDINVERLADHLLSKAQGISMAETPEFMAATFTPQEQQQRKEEIRREFGRIIRRLVDEGRSDQDIFSVLDSFLKARGFSRANAPDIQEVRETIASEREFVAMAQPEGDLPGAAAQGVPPEFAGSPAFGTDATQPNPAIAAESNFWEKKLAEQDRRKREDDKFGLLVGQRAQTSANIERSPDQWLARVQAQRQALFERPISKSPMQMRNQGLVQQVYYSTKVQQ